MSSKANRGIKRTCQNDECGARFYDLNRASIACPVCGTAYTQAPVAPLPETSVEMKPAVRRAPKPADAVVDPVAAEGEVPEVVADELADIEAPEADIAGEEAETFLEPEEEGEGDVSNIIGGVAGEDEET